MAISVVMPVYNASETLRASVESVLNQTFSDFELLIVNDCSTDASQAIIEEFSKMDSRVVPLNNPKNIKIVKSLNFGVSKANYPLVARMDADDICLPNRFEEQVKLFKKSPDLALVGTFYQFLGKEPQLDKKVELPYENDEIKKQILNINPFCHPSVIFQKKAFEETGGYREFFINSEDYDLWLRFSKKYRLGNVPDYLLRYRLSPNGATLGRRWEMWIYENIAKRAYQFPEKDLGELFEDVSSDFSNAKDKDQILGKLIFDLSQVYKATGYKSQALHTLFHLRNDLGNLVMSKWLLKHIFNF